MRFGLREKTTDFAKNHKEVLKKAVVIVSVTAALLFLGKYGEKLTQGKSAGTVDAGDVDPSIVIESAEGAEEHDIEGVSENAGKDADNDGDASDDESDKVPDEKIIADISGAVLSPGVYELQAGSRLEDLIDCAGGLSEDADIDSINRASVVSDGEKIYVPRKSENRPVYSSSENTVEASSAGRKVNINTAGADELETVPGIGPVTAQKILDYRELNGPFASIEELMNVKGIGEAKFEKMKDSVVV
ncbi:MAG: helix-hairpin-helix domain-containing protein [Eubacterium sp.]|jgi:competence protein ComEA